MKAYGDIPKEHLELIKELEDLEAIFNTYEDTFAPELAAKGLTAMSHDYYAMDMEEQGDRLINRAEGIFPGYFMKKIHEHTQKDKEYDKVVNQMSAMPFSYQIMTKLGFKPQ